VLFLKTIIPSRNTHLQRAAVEEGIPYQTFISSILHKYITGRLVERPQPTSA
jgi:hypothetical protein